MILPFAKLGTLVLKTLSKPLANVVKTRAKNHPNFREQIVRFAQWYHRVNVNLQRNLYGHVTDVEIRPLNEERAVTTAADLVGELIVFTVGGVVVIFEVQRSARSEARKEEKIRSERESLRAKDEELEREIGILRERLDALEREHRSNSTWLPGLGVLGGGSSSRSSGGTPSAPRSNKPSLDPEPPLDKKPMEGDGSQ